MVTLNSKDDRQDRYLLTRLSKNPISTFLLTLSRLGETVTVIFDNPDKSCFRRKQESHSYVTVCNKSPDLYISTCFLFRDRSTSKIRSLLLSSRNSHRQCTTIYDVSLSSLVFISLHPVHATPRLILSVPPGRITKTFLLSSSHSTFVGRV